MSGPGLLHSDQAVTDQTAAVVEGDKIPRLKLCWGAGFHGEPIPFAQRGVHAPTGHPKAECLPAEEEVADFQEVCQVEPVADSPRSVPLAHSLGNSLHDSSPLASITHPLASTA